MQARYIASGALCAALLCASGVVASAQTSGGPATAQTDASPAQRLEIMRSRLEAMRRSLQGAVTAVTTKDDAKKDAKKDVQADDPRARLRGLDQEASSILSEVNDVRGKQERAERYDADAISKLETSVADLNTRVEAGLRDTASLRATAGGAPGQAARSNAKKRGFFGRILGRGGDKYAELTGTVAPGRDRVLFEDAAKEVRKGNTERGRYLFNTIITTYPDSSYLPAAKLAIADSFYLEATTSSLIQAGAAYQDWLTFFPTHPLADDVMLKIGEVEMRQMGLADRDVSHARKAETRLKILLQQFPQTALRQKVEAYIRDTQENLAMHNLQIGRFYNQRSNNGNGGLKGAESRLREITEKYPNFSYMDEVLFRLGDLYTQEEEPDEAAKYYQQLARDFPNSEYAEKARAQLETIGAAKPDPDPIKAKMAPPPRPSMTQKIFTEVLGTSGISVSKDGVLISKDGDATSDLIDVAIQHGGELPATTTPLAPVQRRAPARSAAPAITPPSTNTVSAPTKPGDSSGVSLRPTPPGPPANSGSSIASPDLTPAGVPSLATPTTTAPSAITAPAPPPAANGTRSPQ